MRRRELNDQIDRITGSLGGPAAYYCECADETCGESLILPRDAYRAIRADPVRFLVVAGHEKVDLEQVVARHAHYVVVRRADAGSPTPSPSLAPD